jgi:hypothetical protein
VTDNGLCAYRADSEAYNQSYGVGLRSVTKPSPGVVRRQPDKQKGPYQTGAGAGRRSEVFASKIAPKL